MKFELQYSLMGWSQRATGGQRGLEAALCVCHFKMPTLYNKGHHAERSAALYRNILCIRAHFALPQVTTTSACVFHCYFM